MKVKITGIQAKIIAWVGSGGVGFSFICRNIVMPMMSGQTPIMQERPAATVGSKGSRPNRLKIVGRVGRREVLDPAEERRVPHLDGDEQHLVEREEDRDLDQDRQQPASGLIFSFL
jgi:hypothetical protein